MKRVLNFSTSEIGRIIIGISLFLPAFIIDKLNFTTISAVFYLVALALSGAPVFVDAVRGILRRDLLDEKFLMSVASVGAVIIGEMSEGCAVMLFFLVGEYFEHKAVEKSRRSIRSLMDIRPDEACVIVNGKEMTVCADTVAPGSIIIVRAGERIPLDAVVGEGNADIDTSALTGEPVPRSVSSGDEIYAGCVVIDGVLTAKTLRSADESSAARVLDLVENANEKKSKTEAFITKFAHIYTPLVVALAVLVAVVPPIFDIFSWQKSVYNALIFLVISCPCALVISVPMAFFGGIGGAASKGILYKGGNTFSSLAKADVFAFDKTGTLTSGEFTVSEVHAVNISEDELLHIAASAEYGSLHPIAECIKNSSKNKTKPTAFKEFAGRGIFATVGGSDVLVGNLGLLREYGVDISDIISLPGAVYVARDGMLLGYLVISDKVKAEAKTSVDRLRELGINRCVMLSGDRRENALRIGREVGLDEIKAELLPEEKYKELENIIKDSKKTVYVGDGINDAPAIALADVGVAMGSIGSDSAIEAADVVIMSDNLNKLSTAVKIARKTTRISVENIVFALGVKGLILVLGAIGLANMWLAVFADVGVAVISILNSMRCLVCSEE